MIQNHRLVLLTGRDLDNSLMAKEEESKPLHVIHELKDEDLYSQKDSYSNFFKQRLKKKKKVHKDFEHSSETI